MSDIVNSDNVPEGSNIVKLEFKKPMLVKRLTKKPISESGEPGTEDKSENSNIPVLSPTDVPYKVPSWSGLCPEGADYTLEVLKSGIILEKIELNTKPFYVFGRLANCEVIMAHPTISRYHAVLQYKAFEDEDQPVGWYIYDLGSTHGTFLNRQRLKEKRYVRVRVGHQIKFGMSSRIFIVLGPDFDAEGESDLSVTVIKKRAAELKEEQKKMLLDNNEILKEMKQPEDAIHLEKEKKKEEEGIDWGMGEDPEEEPDLADNPYASTTNEELYLQDPKKTLRGFFSREGLELEYDCVEKGVGQFSCSVELPIDDAKGRPVIAEVIHRGKKKEAVVACALEACRILDRVGLLRQAKHESRRRKERDWGADDYYDSDEDTFFDRTGNVEKKRHARMEKLGVVSSQANKPLDYYELVEKIKELESSIEKEEKSIENKREELRHNADCGDKLDDYMKTIDSMPNYYQTTDHKEMISKSKLKIKQMQSELIEMQRLAEVAKPTLLPERTDKAASITMKKSKSVLYGKRMRLKEDPIKKSQNNKGVRQTKPQEAQEFVEEVDSDEDAEHLKVKEEPKTDEKLINIKASNEDRVPFIKTETEETTSLTTSMEIIEEKSDTIKKEENQVPQQSTSIQTNINQEKKVYGPMRPPENYVIPEDYFDQITDRDLPEIEEN